MSSPDRQELIRNAVSFLADPKIHSSPLAQRIQFLEAKGLTAPEIEEALRLAATQAVPSAPLQQQYAPSPYGPVYGPLQQQPQQWDWRDYFITSVISGALAYGAVSLFRKYVAPHLQPPSATAYEADRDALTAQFDAAEALLKEIQQETAAVKVAIEEQKSKVDAATEEVAAVVKDMKEGEERMKDEMREIRQEVDNVRDMLPKLIEKNKESQTQSMAELQQELKSLKALLLSRGPGVSSGVSTPALPKPTIPAWQLAGGSTSGVISTPPLLSPGNVQISNVIPNGKGKEVDTTDNSTDTSNPPS